MSATLLPLLALSFLMIPWALGPREGRNYQEFRGGMLALWWLNRLYCGCWHRLDLTLTAALPESGPALLVSNHTCGIDHMLIQSLTRRPLGFLIAREIYEARFLRFFYDLVGCIPVNRDGRDLTATRAAIRALGEARIVSIFPEGRIHPRSGRELLDGKPGAAYIALRTGATVIPVYLQGTPESDEIGRSLLTPSRSSVRFGPPVDLSDLRRGGRDERSSVAEATRRIMDSIASLKDQSRQEISSRPKPRPNPEPLPARPGWPWP